MKIEGSTSGQKGNDAVKSKVTQRKWGGGNGGRWYQGRPRRRVEATSRAIQRLFLACKSVFKGPGTVPASADVQMLRRLLDQMKLEDVGLSKDLLFFKPEGAVTGIPRISCTTICKCDNFSMCLFFLPPTAVIPLHNHPGMTVFSKLLRGSMHIKAYDFAVPAVLEDGTPSARTDARSGAVVFAERLARLKVDSDFTAPCSTSILYPAAGGNIHTFRAITPCAVLDVLGPPYSEEDGRDCTYYRDHPFLSSPNADASAGEDGACGGPYGWLEEIDAPEELKMDGIAYMGPQILDT